MEQRWERKTEYPQRRGYTWSIRERREERLNILKEQKIWSKRDQGEKNEWTCF